MKTLGIDLGSRTSKIVTFDSEKQQIIAHLVTDTGVNPKETASKLLEDIIRKTGIDRNQFDRIYSTGYGRNITPFAGKRISEITCHAKGVHFLFPNTKTIIDIGGQDSKGISLNSKGKVIDFVMNDKCAAGTGRFLEVSANILDLTVDELSAAYQRFNNKIIINSTCVVFAESGIIGLISRGESTANIVHAVHQSIAKRVKSMICKLHIEEPIVFTGGVALNKAMRLALEENLKMKITTPEYPSITGALGAAILASEAK